MNRSPGSGRPRKLTKFEQREVVIIAKRDSLITTKEIRSEISRKDVSKDTVSRVIDRDGQLASYYQTRKPFINKLNQSKRLKWCKDHKEWKVEDWRR